MIKGVIFDLDGVITDTAEFHYLSWKQLSNEERLNFDKLLNEKLKGVSRAKELGLTPNECIVIEDASSGIEAAHKAGMKAIGIGSKEVLGKAEVVLESTNFLKLKIIQNI